MSGVIRGVVRDWSRPSSGTIQVAVLEVEVMVGPHLDKRVGSRVYINRCSSAMLTGALSWEKMLYMCRVKGDPMDVLGASSSSPVADRQTQSGKTIPELLLAVETIRPS